MAYIRNMFVTKNYELHKIKINKIALVNAFVHIFIHWEET